MKKLIRLIRIMMQNDKALQKLESQVKISQNDLLKRFSFLNADSLSKIFEWGLFVLLCLQSFGQGFALAETLTSEQICMAATALITLLTLLIGGVGIVSTLFYADDIEEYLALPITAVHLVTAKLSIYFFSVLTFAFLIIPALISSLWLHGVAPSLIIWMVFLVLLSAALTSFVVLALSLCFFIVKLKVFSLRNSLWILGTLLPLSLVLAVSSHLAGTYTSTFEGLTRILLYPAVVIIISFFNPIHILHFLEFPTIFTMICVVVLTCVVVVAAGALCLWYMSDTYLWFWFRLNEKTEKKPVPRVRRSLNFRQRGIYASLIRVNALRFWKGQSVWAYPFSAVVVPLALGIPFFMGMLHEEGTTVVVNFIREVMPTPGFMYMLMGMLMVIGYCLGDQSLLARRIISLDGRDFFIIRQTPVKLSKYVAIKYAEAFLYAGLQGITALNILFAVLIFFLQLNELWYAPLLGFFLMTLGLLLRNHIEMLQDMRRPSLYWTDLSDLNTGFVQTIIGLLITGAHIGVLSLLGITGFFLPDTVVGYSLWIIQYVVLFAIQMRVVIRKGTCYLEQLEYVG